MVFYFRCLDDIISPLVKTIPVSDVLDRPQRQLVNTVGVIKHESVRISASAWSRALSSPTHFG